MGDVRDQLLTLLIGMIHNHKKYDLTLNLTASSTYQHPPLIQQPLDVILK